MNEYLINLEEFTAEDYYLMSDIIDEAFIEYESKEQVEVDELIKKFKSINNKLDRKEITEKNLEEINETLEELDKIGKEIKKGNIKKFKALVLFGEIIRYINRIISIAGIIKDIFNKIKGNITAQSVGGMPELSSNEKVTLLGMVKSIGKELISKATLEYIFKQMISPWNLIQIPLKIIHGFLVGKATDYAGYESLIDKTYEMLLQCEAKVMVEKRKAKKSGNKEAEDSYDKVIELIEDAKKEHVKKKIAKDKKIGESTEVLQEYNGNEIKINMFRLVCRDIVHGMTIECENMRAYCNASLYIIRRALEMTEKNKATKIKLIKDKIEDVKSYINDENRQYDSLTLDAIFRKYGRMFTVQFSKYGLASREKFEKRLGKIAKDMGEIMEDYRKEASTIVTSNENFGLNSVLNVLDNKVRINTSEATGREVMRLINSFNDDSERTFQMSSSFITDCIGKFNSSEIKKDLRFKVMNKLFK